MPISFLYSNSPAYLPQFIIVQNVEVASSIGIEAESFSMTERGPERAA